MDRIVVRQWESKILVVGSGLAGLLTALRLAPRQVTLLTKTPLLAGGSSNLAQGGVAAAMALDDSPADHAEDTLTAGAGLCDKAMVRLLAEDGAREARALIDEGLPFDLGNNGAPLLGREGAHRRARILHAGGDATGHTLIQALIQRVRTVPSIRVIERAFAVDLTIADGRIVGLLACHADDGSEQSNGKGWIFHRCPNVILATGGIGNLYLRTTNPPEATGDGLAMAARAGAKLGDLEFVQFHPTALATGPGGEDRPMPLMTEALRGEGAHLLDGAGNRFMINEHKLAELAPRDILARAVWRHIQAGEVVSLDLRPALARAGPSRFPTVLAYCRAAGFDANSTPVPIAPAAHYHMGGIVTDAMGRTSLPGLWACGEVACTGVHGANRLASNSLLEAIVFARRIADDIGHQSATTRSATTQSATKQQQAPPEVPDAAGAPELATLAHGVRRTLYDKVGLWRDGDGLSAAMATLATLSQRLESLPAATDASPADVMLWGETRNMLLVARLITLAAHNRKESRGAHFRADAPPDTPPMPRQFLALSDLAPSPIPAEPGPS
ncbi:MAG: L-aspartate oxidase [Rhodospirillaceae bacterium]